MNKIHYLIPLILGLGLSIAILPGLVDQAMSQNEGLYDASPSGVPQGNTSGTENITTPSENIPTVNVTGIDSSDADFSDDVG